MFIKRKALAKNPMANNPIIAAFLDANCEAEFQQIDLSDLLIEKTGFGWFFNFDILSFCALTNKIDHLNYLLNTYPHLNPSIDENHALWLAAEAGHLEIVQRLLQCNEVIENITAEDNKIIRLAAKEGNIEIVLYLLEIDEVRDSLGFEYNEALDTLTTVILQAIDRLENKTFRTNSVEEKALDLRKKLTAFYLESLDKNITVVELLNAIPKQHTHKKSGERVAGGKTTLNLILQHERYVLGVEYTGGSTVYGECYKITQTTSSFKKVVSALKLSKQEIAELKIPTIDTTRYGTNNPKDSFIDIVSGNYKRSILLQWVAGNFDSPDTVADLLERGANPDLVDTNGRNALQIAVYKFKPNCVHILLQHNANVLPTNDMSSPLTLAINHIFASYNFHGGSKDGFIQITKQLIEHLFRTRDIEDNRNELLNGLKHLLKTCIKNYDDELFNEAVNFVANTIIIFTIFNQNELIKTNTSIYNAKLIGNIDEIRLFISEHNEKLDDDTRSNLITAYELYSEHDVSYANVLDISDSIVLRNTQSDIPSDLEEKKNYPSPANSSYLDDISEDSYPFDGTLLSHDSGEEKFFSEDNNSHHSVADLTTLQEEVKAQANIASAIISRALRSRSLQPINSILRKLVDLNEQIQIINPTQYDIEKYYGLIDHVKNHSMSISEQNDIAKDDIKNVIGSIESLVEICNLLLQVEHGDPQPKLNSHTLFNSQHSISSTTVNSDFIAQKGGSAATNF